MISPTDLQRTSSIFREAGKVLYDVNLDGYHQLYLERRLNHLALRHGITKGSAMVDLLVNQPGLVDELKKELHIGYTTFFRDPAFFLRATELIRRKLDQQNTVHIWHAGCSRGHEVYSLIMLLKEQELLDRCIIYATDINPKHLAEAERGIVSTDDILTAVKPYLTSGGNHHIGHHFTISGSKAIFRHELLRKIKFGRHDLGKDLPFQQFDFISCRNVFIYYQSFYQKKLLQCITASLKEEGYLGLSPAEKLEDCEAAFNLNCFDYHLNIYKKNGDCKNFPQNTNTTI